MLLLGLVWVVNFAISFFNARTVGLVWVETKTIGGWQRFMAWMGAIMSASGFTWCYMIILLFGVYFLQPNPVQPEHEEGAKIITMVHLQTGFALGYLIIIPGILFSGTMIWIDSLVQAWRRRDLSSIGVATWNTFAHLHNSYSAMRGIPEAWKAVSNSLGKSRSKDKGAIIIIILVIAAAVSGILTTYAIVSHYAGTRTLPERETA